MVREERGGGEGRKKEGGRERECIANWNFMSCDNASSWLPFLSSHLFFPLVATSGRMDCMFQVLPDQEDSISMGDILSDGLLVVELDPSGRLQAIPETPTNPQILFSPEEEVKWVDHQCVDKVCVTICLL